ncbi:sperm microtubule inner protein 6 isoform X2 [Castor canadensis]|uniref:Sperm microtubule inner protein 6 isoform X2 n=1 Tax=Castor canadensis TaxID=51338 RepID=A0AC58KSD2_CASCN
MSLGLFSLHPLRPDLHISDHSLLLETTSFLSSSDASPSWVSYILTVETWGLLRVLSRAVFSPCPSSKAILSNPPMALIIVTPNLYFQPDLSPELYSPSSNYGHLQRAVPKPFKLILSDCWGVDHRGPCMTGLGVSDSVKGFNSGSVLIKSPFVEDTYCPSYLGNDRYSPWRTRTAPYNSTHWNKYAICLPRRPKTGMETVVRGMPLEYPPKPELLNAYEREVVMNMLNSLSRNQQLPQIAPRYGCLDPLPGRLPFQGYNSPCSGRHYCLRGMDYHASGVPGTERSLRPLCAEQPTVRSILPYEHRPGMQCAVTTPPPSYYPYQNLRWDTSHFKKTGGPRRNNYVVHPEFVSETYPDYRCW